jgi:hypothetical protein
MRKYILVFILLVCAFSVFAVAECDEQQVSQFFSIELQRQDKDINSKLDERLNRFEGTLTEQATEFKRNIEEQFVKGSIFFSIILLGVSLFTQGLIGFFRTRAERRYLEMIYKDNHDRHEEEKSLIAQVRGKHGKQ